MDKEKIKNIVSEIAFCLLYCFILYILTYIIRFEDTKRSILTAILFISENPIVYIVLPYIIILSSFMILKSIFRDNFRTSIILTVITLIITIISFYKYRILELPFLPSDILLIGTVKEIAEFGLTFPPLAMILVCLILILLLFFYHKLRKTHYEKTKMTFKSEAYRIPLFIIGITLIYFICLAPNRFEIINVQNELQNNYTWYGGNAVFFLHLGDLYSVPPKEYKKENIEKIKIENSTEDLEENIDKEEKPNVIIIMNESFSDPSKINNVEFSVDPLENIKKLALEDKNCILGNLVTPVMGGGTSLPEFEAITGMTSYFLEHQIFPFTSYIKKDMNSTVRAYNSDGYVTVGLHTYKKNFYNRKNVYKYLGFQKTIFSEDIDNPEYKGGYISDNEFANQIIKVFNETEGNKFVFGVTMQNHMPYEGEVYRESDFDINLSSNNLTDKEKQELRTYTQGVHDGDKMYIKLVEYLKTIKEPTIILMFGDHIPAMLAKSNYEGYINNIVDGYTTPYVIWANYDIDYEEKIFDYMSPSALSLSIMDIANVKIPWYLKEFKKLYEEYPAINNQLAINKEYEVFKPSDIEKSEVIENCEILQFDLLIKKKYIPIN